MNQMSGRKHNEVASYAAQYSKSFVERWDDLIDWDKRKAGENGFFEDVLKRHGVRSVIDVSTGSGFHAVQLKQAGFDVVATDGSSTMLTKARANFRQRGLDIQSHYRDWLSLDPQELGQFDAVVCLGSSLCHVFEAKARCEVLEKFRALLKPGGLLIVDQRNFFAIRAGNFKSSGNYYYCGKHASVTLGQVDQHLCEFIYSFDNEEQYRLKVYPLLPGELTTEVLASGFSDHRSYGDFQPDYDMMQCDFVIHTAVASARKPA
ncbi:bifunctional 2-polyprenyl-6-hydroxyphenol methylase/3-demethylubiquinol 3-O-methyltransferase UbiG [Pseudomonas sp. FP2309]|uniref:class I SAM-dependent methyltransferase n=1 Tax=Pseudomonas sp. FP2309 TaxID=2954091 RepID=UPI00273498F1|nr:class I SAM-dependent methyltransferase [Pseudomonas sp. FP2309]WLH70337.1 class I SAM-dependent methyltransferase [Pseudomonas sp. FP2309]